ncbi:hypothetical protein SLEP1_g29225 [Rubroshorea leprosula]|uniref:Uncharacterized protein n=1 Tax=Rubroshorea leprosula TaxID=152421 RepID=A0AAV5JW79_9ROSI|nr:hypothetical protein SLEP1_g29225 [Rubroshorea leprosula]
MTPLNTIVCKIEEQDNPSKLPLGSSASSSCIDEIRAVDLGFDRRLKLASRRSEIAAVEVDWPIHHHHHHHLSKRTAEIRSHRVPILRTTAVELMVANTGACLRQTEASSSMVCGGSAG